jgi:hypothetical protein
MLRRETYRARLLRWLSLRSFELKSTGIGIFLIVLIAVSFVIVLVGRAFDDLDHRKTTPVIATITGFGTGSPRRPTWIVTAQDAEGLTGVAGVPVDRIAGCRVGDKIRARQVGLTLRLDPAPCPIKLRPGEAKTSSAG